MESLKGYYRDPEINSTTVHDNLSCYSKWFLSTSLMQAKNPCVHIKYILFNYFLSFQSCEAKRKKTVEKERNGTLSRHENINTQPLKLITRNL